MKRRFKSRLFLTSVCLLIGLLITGEHGFGRAEAPVSQKKAIYLELMEENLDTFDQTLFRIRKKPQFHTFIFHDNKLAIDSRGLELTDDEIKALGYFSKKKIHLTEAEGITIYLQHIIRFYGAGRKDHWSEYYVFNPTTLSM